MTSGRSYHLELNGAPLEWELDGGKMSLFGIPAALFWLDPSLRHVLEPLVEEVGVPLFRLLVAYQSSVGAEQDYKGLFAPCATFEEGFSAWRSAITMAGWGSAELTSFDRGLRRAVVILRDPWELQMQREVAERWGCPFLQGKLIGIFSRAFGVNCWAEEVGASLEEGACSVELHVSPSDKTIEVELERLRKARREEVERPLREAKRALLEKLEFIEKQKEDIRALTTPILQVWEGVLALPIIGAMDQRRASELTGSLLAAIVSNGARFTLLDLTGVDTVEPSTADHFAKIVRAVGLLGAECVVCGIQPAVAQTMASLGVWPPGVRTFSTMQSALRAVIDRQG